MQAGRPPADVRLLAVSKSFSLEHVQAAAAAGQQDFGENRVQEALQKMGRSADLRIRWHLIGPLQSNKVRKAAARFSGIQSVDSLRLLGLSSVEVLLDPAGSVAASYDLPKMPTSYVIDKKGVVRFVHDGYEDGDVARFSKELDELLK